jgi:hypothetical protein
MKKLIASLLLSLPFIKATAQIPEDALRYSYYLNQGSARSMAIGGAMTSLGGDISAIFINPAGLGTYRNREVVLGLNGGQINNKFAYRDSLSNSKKGGWGFGTTGFLLGFPNEGNSKKSSSIGIAVQQTVGFKNDQQYSGYNNYSSFSEQFAEEMAKSNLSIGQVLNSNSPLPYTAAPALFTYLIDTVTINGITQIKSAPEYLLDSGTAILQNMRKQTWGSMHEIGFSIASHQQDKWLYGATFVIPIVSYKQITTFTEKDPTANTNNGFDFFTFTDEYKSTGSGVQAKLGVIYKPLTHVRLGMAFHSPAMIMFTEERSTRLTTKLENPDQFSQANSNTFTNGQKGLSNYAYRSPWRALVSASYVFREEDNILKQKGFVTADLEYVRHSSGRYTSQNEEVTPEEKAYFKELTNVIKTYYKGSFQFKLGAELKFKVMMLRGGFAYAGNPYRDETFKANRMQISGGLGYRNHGFYVDLTYVHFENKDIDVPYRLSDRSNTYAGLQQRGGTILATAGVKF